MGSMFGLMIAIYSRNMLLVYTQMKLCLDCEVKALFSPYIYIYIYIIKIQREVLSENQQYIFQSAQQTDVLLIPIRAM